MPPVRSRAISCALALLFASAALATAQAPLAWTPLNKWALPQGASCCRCGALWLSPAAHQPKCPPHRFYVLSPVSTTTGMESTPGRCPGPKGAVGCSCCCSARSASLSPPSACPLREAIWQMVGLQSCKFATSNDWCHRLECPPLCMAQLAVGILHFLGCFCAPTRVLPCSGLSFFSFILVYDPS